MSADVQQPMTVRFAGGDAAPENVRARELATLLIAVEEGVITLAKEARDPSEERVDLAIALTSLQDRSLGLAFSTKYPDIVLPAFVRVGNIITESLFDTVSVPVLNSLRTILGFVKRHTCVAEFRVGDFTVQPIAVMTPETMIHGPPLIKGDTTLYGRIVRVGGQDPVVRLEVADGEYVTCELSVDLARQLGGRLYDRVGLAGTATWDADTWSVTKFVVDHIDGFIDSTPLATIRHLRDTYGKYFDDIEDVDAFVRSLREEDAE